MADTREREEERRDNFVKKIKILFPGIEITKVVDDLFGSEMQVTGTTKPKVGVGNFRPLGKTHHVSVTDFDISELHISSTRLQRPLNPNEVKAYKAKLKREAAINAKIQE